jgi:hypothetical protein
VKIEERRAGAALEQLDAPPVDGERALTAGRGYGVLHGVSMARDGPNTSWMIDIPSRG